MIYLYHGGGASITEISGPALPPDEWLRIRTAALRLLGARGHTQAASLLRDYAFELLGATNFFNDEFAVLRLTATLDQYVALSEVQHDTKAQQPFKVVADTIAEIGPYVRFIVMLLESEDGPLPVSAPSPQITSEAVESALADAELLLRSRGPASAIDRVHTALHGFLRAALERGGQPASATASVPELFKRLREAHPAMRNLGARGDDSKRIVMALATVVDAATALRNNASGAHPHEETLDAPEAMLVINAARSLLHFLDHKLA